MFCSFSHLSGGKSRLLSVGVNEGVTSLRGPRYDRFWFTLLVHWNEYLWYCRAWSSFDTISGTNIIFKMHAADRKVWRLWTEAELNKGVT